LDRSPCRPRSVLRPHGLRLTSGHERTVDITVRGSVTLSNCLLTTEGDYTIRCQHKDSKVVRHALNSNRGRAGNISMGTGRRPVTRARRRLSVLPCSLPRQRPAQSFANAIAIYERKLRKRHHRRTVRTRPAADDLDPNCICCADRIHETAQRQGTTWQGQGRSLRKRVFLSCRA
jgi:hypothetical protein